MNRIIAITGPSGTGKTALGLSLLKRGVIVKLSTTRNRRTDDDENNFRYMSHIEFKKCADDNQFLFWSGDSETIAKEKGNFYGILKEDFENAFKNSCDVIMFVSYKDIDAICELKKIFNIDIVQLKFRNINEMKNRIANRENIEARINSAKEYEEKYGDKVSCVASSVIFTDELDIQETYEKVYKDLKLNQKYYYIGFNANNSICNENFFDGSFSLYPNGEKGNVYFLEHVDASLDVETLYDKYKEFVLSKITPEMKLYAFNEKVKKLFEDSVHFEASVDFEIVNYLNEKFKLKKDLKEIVPILDYEIKKGKDIEFNDEIVAQEKTGAGGFTTLLIRRKKDLKLLKPDTEYSVTKYFKNNPLNTTMIISDNEILFLSKSMQLIKLIENRFRYIGADFEFVNNLPKEICQNIWDISMKVANFAKDKGYRGILGIDLMQRGDEVYFTEVNPRFQSSSFLISNELKKWNLSVAYLNDLGVRGKKLPEIDEIVLHSSFLNCNESEPFNEMNPDYIVLNGYFAENKDSNYRKVFERSIAPEIDIEKV